MTDVHLFDPSPYGEGNPARRVRTPVLTPVDCDPRWHLLVCRDEVDTFAHLIRHVDEWATAHTFCRKKGRCLPLDGLKANACPKCAKRAREEDAS